MSCCSMLRLVWTGVPSRWHCPQTKGTFIAATDERGSFTGRMSWLPWQFTHRGARASPRAAALPCNDFASCCASSPWQEPQLTLASGVECGSSLPSRSAWQEVHCSEPWMEPVNFFWSTKSDTVRPPRLVDSDLSPWHARQSSLVGPCAAQHCGRSNTKASESSAENERAFLRRRGQDRPGVSVARRLMYEQSAMAYISRFQTWRTSVCDLLHLWV